MLRKLLRRILGSGSGSGDVTQSTLSVHSSPHNTKTKIRVSLIHATNGRILEVSSQSPKSNPIYGDDWVTDMFIIEEGQTLSEAIGLIMTMRGLEQ